MNILLVTPSQQSELKNRNLKIVRGLLPPLGIGYIAAVLENAGHVVKIIDAQVMGYDYNDIIQCADAFGPDILGISVVTTVVSEAYELARNFKRKFSAVKVVLGGAHPTCFPEETMALGPEIDAAVIGEGEYIMLDLVNALTRGQGLAEIRGIYYRNTNGEIIKNLPSEKEVDLETLPFPARHLYPFSRYSSSSFEKRLFPATSLFASRGCDYARCTFCCRSGKMKRKYRTQSPAKTIEEIRFLVKVYGMKTIIFYDDDLFSNEVWLEDFCRLMLREPYRIIWSCWGRSDTIKFELLKLAKAAGCWCVTCGFESGNQDLLDSIKKGITLEQSRRVADWMHQLDLEFMGSFMLGLPGETPEKGKRTIDFAIELDCTHAQFAPTQPLIGTQLYEDALKSGKFVSQAPSVSNSRFPKRKAVRVEVMPGVSYVPNGYKDAYEIEHLCWLGYRRFYLRPKYF